MRRDPEGNELSHLLRFGQLGGKRVLDIGCGDGLLTSRFAPQAAAVVAVDPSLPELREARSGRPQGPAPPAPFSAAPRPPPPRGGAGRRSGGPRRPPG